MLKDIINSSHFQIERCFVCNEIKAFIPTNHVNINLSIGGTKILTAIVDNKGNIVWESSPYQWRYSLEHIAGFTILQKRVWFINQMTQEILKAKDYLNSHHPHLLVEGIGIAWAGPISRNHKIIGPNIEGFKIDQLSAQEAACGGIDLIALLQSNLIGCGMEIAISLLNDADAEGLVAFNQDHVENGMLLILGTGIGAGIIKQSHVYFGPDHFLCRMGEIGHHIIFDECTKRYHYYGMDSKGIIRHNHKAQTMMDCLAGPGIAKRFLNLLKQENCVNDYLNQDLAKDAAEYFHHSKLHLNLEQATLQCISEQARNGDSRCLHVIVQIGVKIGQALRVFMDHFSHEHFIKHLKLAGSIGQHFGLNAKSDKDLFIEAIREGLS